jgi:hypothetical protein
VDIADIGFTFKKFLDVVEPDGFSPDEMPVIKIGGKIGWGTVIGTFNVYNNPGVFMEKTENLLIEMMEGLNAVLYFGMERVPRIHGNSEQVTLYIANYAATKLGNTPWRSFYFINRELSSKEFLGLMEELATDVLRTEGGKLRVIKSFKKGLVGSILE